MILEVRSLPDHDSILVHSPHAVEWDLVYHAIIMFKREESGSAGIEVNRGEGDDSLPAGDPVVITEREAPLPEFGVPADAVKQRVERPQGVSRSQFVGTAAENISSRAA